MDFGGRDLQIRLAIPDIHNVIDRAVAMIGANKHKTFAQQQDGEDSAQSQMGSVAPTVTAAAADIVVIHF